MVGILGANSLSGEAYEISNSLRFNDNDSPRLTRTPSGAGNRRTFTLSVWFKLQATTTTERILLTADDGTDNNGNFDYIAVKQDSRILVYGYEGSENQQVISTQILRDPSAWYHLVVAFDTTQGTAANRIKVYLNGSQITDFLTANYPSQNLQTRINNNNRHRISSYPEQDASYFDGYMAEYHLIDGQQLTPSDFGEFNNNGVWIPKAYEGTYGTNGFYLEFKETGTGQNSSGIGADTSGNDNHWAVTNLTASDVVIDTPTNNFATFNPLAAKHDALPTLSQGNLSIATQGTQATISMPSGKWYMEVLATSGDADYAFGITEIHEANSVVMSGGANARAGFIYQANSNVRQGGSGTVVANYATYTNGDILSFSYDTSNRQLKAYKNNSLQGTLTLASPQSDYIFTAICLGGSYTANFGQDSSFAGAKTAQGNTDDNDQGDFYYAVPSGFYSLCTKNLGEFG